MDKEIINDNEEDFDIDELLKEEEDNPVDEEMTEESSKPIAKRGRGRPQGTSKKDNKPEVPAEVTMVNKELSEMEWQPFAQPAYEGYQNIKTGELIDKGEALRRALCYAQEAARNSR